MQNYEKCDWPLMAKQKNILTFAKNNMRIYENRYYHSLTGND